MIEIGKYYKVKNKPNEIGKQWHWLMGKWVKIEGELVIMGEYRKYPISHNLYRVPNDGYSTRALRIREDLIETGEDK